jgi:protein-L-isoaspartate(D-aspartate) O-methyltransferase
MDQPLKEGNIHISAPHIYGSIVEALELSPNSCTSFLNIGSGTGYLSCVVAHILGPASTHYAVDIHADVIAHSRRAIRAWKNSRPDDSFPQMEVLQGNGLCINHNQGEAAVGLDRIYLGAAVEKRHLNQLVELLRPGGILVGPGTANCACGFVPLCIL